MLVPKRKEKEKLKIETGDEFKVASNAKGLEWHPSVIVMEEIQKEPTILVMSTISVLLVQMVALMAGVMALITMTK